jgi:ferric-dicitrate binding protein FerR (iron transport regulator)
VTSAECGRGWEAQALREGRFGPKEQESFERHCRACAFCAEQGVRDERLRTLGQGLPVVEPGDLAQRRLRARILRDATTGFASQASHSWRRVACAWSLGVVLVAIAGLMGAKMASRTQVAAPTSAMASHPPAPLAGSVLPSAGTLWTQTREGGIERVDLETGTLRVHVRPQRPGERFFVHLPDGEIEVRGTTFEVTALDGSTRHVGVDNGTVVLRVRGSPDRSLGPGMSWARSESDPSSSREVPAIASSALASAILRHRSEGVLLSGDNGASVYVDAMRSFREGHYDRAATTFHAFTLAYPLATEAEDASFLEALSMERAGRWDAAAVAAERHLERFPRSFRRKEASILVARAARRRGRCDEALGVLAPWTSEPVDAEIESVMVACRDGGASLR